MNEMLIYSLSIAVFAFVFSGLLITPGNILSFYDRLILDKLPDVLAKPLGYCPRCFAGQIALWGYLAFDGYSFLWHVLFVAWTIFFTEVILVLHGKFSM